MLEKKEGKPIVFLLTVTNKEGIGWPNELTSSRILTQDISIHFQSQDVILVLVENG